MDLVSSVPSRIPIGTPSISEVLHLLERNHHQNILKSKSKSTLKENRKSKQGCKSTKYKKSNYYKGDENFTKSTYENEDLIMNINNHENKEKSFKFDDNMTNKELETLEKFKLYSSAIAKPCKKCQKHYSRLGIRPWTLIPDENNQNNYDENQNSDESKGAHTNAISFLDEKFDSQHEIKDNSKIERNEKKSRNSPPDYAGGYGMIKPDKLYGTRCAATNSDDVLINKNIENIPTRNINIPRNNAKNVLYGLQRCREILLRNSHLLPRYSIKSIFTNIHSFEPHLISTLG